MKLFLIAVSALFSTVSLAQTVQLRDVARIEGINYGLIYKTTVDNSGTLIVVDEKDKILVRKGLHPRTMTEILSLSYQLATAEVKTTYSGIICMMVAPPNYSTLSVSQMLPQSTDFSGEFREILGPQGCWVGKHIAPTSDHAREAALALKKMMEVLTFEAVNYTK